MRTTLWDWARVALPWSCLVLLPYRRSVEIPVAIMAIGGLAFLVYRRAELLREPGVHLFACVFACMWIPMVISIPGAVQIEETVRVTLMHLRLLLAGVFIVVALGERVPWERFLRLSAWLLVLWILDAAVQAGFGRDLLGQPPTIGRITGPYGDRSGKFGLVLAVLAPLLIEHARAHWPRWALSPVSVAIVLTVFAGGTRSGWVTIAALVVAYTVAVWLRDGRFPWQPVFRAAVAGVVALVAASALLERAYVRLLEIVDFILGVATVNSVDHRIWIWRAAWNSFAAEPLTGIGARGFRYGYAQHAAAGDPYAAAVPPIHASHPHQYLLEIAAETGLVGLTGLTIAIVLLIRAALRLPMTDRALVLPAGLCLMLALWPLNTHIATYSALWSQVLWWLIALYCASIAMARHPHPGSGAASDQALPLTRA